MIFYEKTIENKVPESRCSVTKSVYLFSPFYICKMFLQYILCGGRKLGLRNFKPNSFTPILRLRLILTFRRSAGKSCSVLYIYNLNVSNFSQSEISL